MQDWEDWSQNDNRIDHANQHVVEYNHGRDDLRDSSDGKKDDYGERNRDPESHARHERNPKPESHSSHQRNHELQLHASHMVSMGLGIWNIQVSVGQT